MKQSSLFGFSNSVEMLYCWSDKCRKRSKIVGVGPHEGLVVLECGCVSNRDMSARWEVWHRTGVWKE